ncbi:MAG: glycoside hydrolase family 127 protein, partial [Oscillospiraceae bacterium]|nr:glycoside hydrolase family 127 protein [Oscillospiraceae bacterium]
MRKGFMKKALCILLVIGLLAPFAPVGAIAISDAGHTLTTSIEPERLVIPGSTNLARRAFTGTGGTAGVQNDFDVRISGPRINGGTILNVLNDGQAAFPLTTGSAFNTWGGAAGTTGDPYHLTLSWPEPKVITGSSIRWWIWTDTGVAWPVTAFIEYSMDELPNSHPPQMTTMGNMEATYPHLADLANLNWTRVYSAGTAHNANTPGQSSIHNTLWNNLVFEEPILARHVRVTVVSRGATGTAPGFGVNRWHVHGFEADDQTRDVYALDARMFQNIISNIALPAVGAEGSLITWSGSTNAALANDGTVTRPPVGAAPATGTITATATDPNNPANSVTRTFNFNVLPVPNVQEVMDAIDLGVLEDRITNLDVPTSTGDGVTITWESDSWYVWSDGTVLRPPLGQPDATVVLTATGTYDGVSVTRQFTVTVPAHVDDGMRAIVSAESPVIDQPVGTAPRLPNHVLVTYNDDTVEMRRVRWDGHTTPEQIAQTNMPLGHQWTLGGVIMGDGFPVTADITVVAEPWEIPSNVPSAAALPWGAVTVDNDPDGEMNRLTQNRAGSINYILNLPIDRYIRPFREAYGLCVGYGLPLGHIDRYRPGVGWWQKLRGFGSGHYMTGLALAYASPVTTGQRIELLERMERMTRELRQMQEMTMGIPIPANIADPAWQMTDTSAGPVRDGVNPGVEHPTENRFWEARDFLGHLNLDGTWFVYGDPVYGDPVPAAAPAPPTGVNAFPTGATPIPGRPGEFRTHEESIADWRVMRLRTSPYGTLQNWIGEIPDRGDGGSVGGGGTGAWPTNRFVVGHAPNPLEFGWGHLNAIPPHHIVGNEAYLGYNDAGNGVWAPYYGYHKVAAGLVDIFNTLDGNDTVYTLNGRQVSTQEIADMAIQIALDMGIWMDNRFYHRTREGFVPPGVTTGNATFSTSRPGYRATSWGQYIAGEFGGINETMARLYLLTRDDARFTHDPRQLRAAEAFWNDGASGDTNNQPFYTALAENRDSIRELHANTHIPMITGLLWKYRASNDPIDWNIAYNFWNYNLGRYAWATGNVKGNIRNIELYVGAYNQVHHLLAHTGANETCAAYNLMKLGKYLKEHDPDNAAFSDHIERLFIGQMIGSHVAGSQTNQNTYHYPIHQGTIRSRGGATSPDSSCCAGTGLENHVKYQDAIYFTSTDNETLWVSLYKPSTATWAAQDVVITQETVWPSEVATFTVEPGAGTDEFEMRFRVPFWATSNFDILLNGVSLKALNGGAFTPTTYATTGVRTWSDTDVVEVYMPWDVWIDYLPTMHRGRWVGAVMYGPVLMATTGIEGSGTSAPNAAQLAIRNEFRDAWLEVDSFLTTVNQGETCDDATITIVPRRQMGVGAIDAVPGVANNATRHVPALNIMVSGTEREFLPHFFVGGPGHANFTTYFMIDIQGSAWFDEKYDLFDLLIMGRRMVESGAFTDDSVAPLQRALTTGANIYNAEGSILPEITAAIRAIEDAIAGLVERPDAELPIAELEALLAYAATYDKEDFTWDSFATLEDAIASGEAALAATPRTAVEIITAISQIEAAIRYLVPADAVNKDALRVALAAADVNVNPFVLLGDRRWEENWYSSFTRLSWHEYIKLREEARAVYNSRFYTDFVIVPDNGSVPGEAVGTFVETRNFSQREVDDITRRLNEMGLLNAELADERECLRDILDRLAALDRARLTAEEIAALDAALVSGEERYVYASLTFLERDGIVQELTELYKELTTAAGDGMSLVLETVTAAPGESVEVSLSVENNVGLSTADIHIEFADDDIEL